MTALAHAEVIGDPIDHSLSPIIHGYWLKTLGIAARYDRRRVDRAGLPAYLAEMRQDPLWRGANVTMPLKLDALALADDASDLAVTAGAANLLLPREGKLFAANTDIGAIATLIERLRGDGAAMRSVTVFGNGGAARAALVALRLAGIGNVVIYARDLAAARARSVEFGLPRPARGLTEQVVSDGLINATPLGMPGIACLNCDLSGLPAAGWVFDMVTTASPLLDEARRAKLLTASGIEMLIEQAATSFRLLFNAEAPRDRDVELRERLGQ
jgi:shikimate dehydrogenase